VTLVHRLLAGAIGAVLVVGAVAAATTSGGGVGRRRASIATAAAPTVPTTSTTLPPAFTPADAHFSAVFPVQPQRQQQPFVAAGVTLTQIFYLAAAGDEQVGVGFAEFPSTLTTSTTSPTTRTTAGSRTTASTRVTPAQTVMPDIQRILDAGVNGGAQRVNGTVVARSNTTYLGGRAEDGVVTAAGMVLRVRAFFEANALYTLVGSASALNAPHPDYDRLLATFQTA
jgi:hypothetical protein